MSKVDLITLALAKKYTDISMEGGGAVAGKNCTIESITPITGGNRVTYKWYLDDGTEQTDTMDVMDGQDGNDGNGIASVEKTGTSGLVDTYTITFTNGDTTTFTVTNGADGEDGEGVPTGGTAGQVLVKKSSEDYDIEWGTPAGGGDMLKSVYDTDNDGKVDSAENADTVGGHTVAKDVPADAKFTDTVYDDTEIRGDIADKVDKVTGKGLSTNDYSDADKAIVDGVTSALAGKADVADIPSKTSDLTNDSGFITKAVNDLVNYYLNSETYSKTEVDDIVTAIKNSRFEVVATLPTTDIKTNVIYLVPKSPSQTSNVKDEYINLDGTTSGWEKIGDTEIDLSDYVTTQALNTALAAYTTTADLTTLLAGKQDTLTFDDAPTENSNNPVKSNGIYAANQNIYEVMGQNGAKNLIPFDIDAMKAVNVGGTWSGNEYTYNGITFAVNSDGTITVSGIASALTRLAVTNAQFENGKAYTMTGCPEGGNHVDTYTLYTQTVQNYDDGEGVTFNWNSAITSIAIAIFSGVDLTTPITFKPMLRLASDTDTTYQPYSKTNQKLTAETQALANQANDMVNVLGAKNLIPYPYHRQNGYTTNGATFTYDDEGVITVNKVVGNSTAYFALFSNILYPDAEKFLEPNTSYILSMELENATDTSCFVQTLNGSDLAAIRNKTTGKYEISFTTTETVDSLAVALYYGAEKTENNAKVKLMIRLASIQDDTWVPYVPTNKELMSCKLNGYVGAKNLLAYPYKHTTKSENGVTFTDNGDGTITVNTPTSASAETTFYLSQSIQSILDTGMYILSGCPSGGNRTSGYFMEFAELATSSSNWKMFGTDTGEGAIAHIDSTHYAIHAYIRIRSGATVSNLTFKPMIRRVEDTDPTWQPYAKTNRQLMEDSVDWRSNSVLGAKNFLTNKGTATTQGVEFAVDSNGVFTVTRKSAGSSHAYYSNGRFTLKPGTYIFSNGYNSLPSGIQATYLYNHTDGVYFINCNNGPKTFTITEEKELAFNIEVQTTQSPSGVKIYPMIRLASDNDATYQPYAKTNRELTEAVDGMMMKVGRYTKTVKGINTTYGALIDQICADMKTMIDGFADTNTKVIPISITIDGLVTVFVRPDQYKKGDNFNIVAYCTSCDGTTFNTFYLRGLSGSGNSTIYRQDVTASSQAINDFTSTSFTGDKNISLIYDRYQII